MIRVESFSVSMDDFLSDEFFLYSVNPVTKTNWYGREYNIGVGKLKLTLWVLGAVLAGLILVVGFVWFIFAGVYTMKKKQKQTDEVFAMELQEAHQQAQEQGIELPSVLMQEVHKNNKVAP